MNEPLFTSGKIVKHRNGDLYNILITPPSCFIEKDKVPAYIYFDEKGNTWVRPQVEMEDGRFELFHPIP